MCCLVLAASESHVLVYGPTASRICDGVHGPYCHWKPCGYTWSEPPPEAMMISEGHAIAVTIPIWPPLLSRAVMMSGPELQSRAMAVSCPWSCWNWGMCWWLWFMLPLRAKGKLAPVVWAPEKWSCSSQATSWESGLPSRKNWPQRHGLPLDFPATATRELAQPLAIGPGEVDWIAWMWESCLWHLLKRDQWTWWRSGLTKSATTETHIQGSFPVSSPTFSVIYM